MAETFTVSVRVGVYEFLREFDNGPSALECYDYLANESDGVIDGNWATQESKASIDTVTIRRRMTTTRIGDPNRQ